MRKRRMTRQQQKAMFAKRERQKEFYYQIKPLYLDIAELKARRMSNIRYIRNKRTPETDKNQMRKDNLMMAYTIKYKEDKIKQLIKKEKMSEDWA